MTTLLTDVGMKVDMDTVTGISKGMASDMGSALASQGPIVTSLTATYPQAFAIYAFGSQVQGTAGPESDLDLAILLPGYAEPLHLWDLAGRLADVVARHVDLLDFRAASTVMQYQIITTGQRLWHSGVDAGLFESYVLSEMTALNTARAGLLADIRKDGRIYAR